MLPDSMQQLPDQQSQTQSQSQTQFTCEPACDNGVCVDQNLCKCVAGWTGSGCSECKIRNRIYYNLKYDI